MATNVSVVIQTHNEEKNIEDCIVSAKLLTDLILVVDTGSNDRTATIARNHGGIVRSFPFSRYVEPARKFAVENAPGDWVFILDADERMTKELAAEIVETIGFAKYTYYKVPRKNVFGRKKWLKHGGWWPDHQMRLIRKEAFKDWPDRIHSTPIIEGEMGFLKQPFTHYFHGDLESMVDKTIVYEEIEAELLHTAGRPADVPTFFRKFLGELMRRLVFKKGYADGDIGIIESIYQAFSKTVTYLFLYEKKKGRTV
jgi:glycosyltransferase involved in cell wall biosynthesis